MLNRDSFLIHTISFSFISATLYIWKGIQESFLVGTYIYIVFNVIYIPFALIFKRKYFSIYLLSYSFALISIYANSPSYLYNNYTAFFVMCLVLLFIPKWKFIAIAIYAILITIAFAFNTESLCHYLIHIVRTMYYFYLLFHIIRTRYERIVPTHLNCLELTEDEVNILDQMLSGKKQKEVIGFSINTVTKKLNNAKTRNHINTTQELLFAYMEETRKTNNCE